MSSAKSSETGSATTEKATSANASRNATKRAGRERDRDEDTVDHFSIGDDTHDPDDAARAEGHGKSTKPTSRVGATQVVARRSPGDTITDDAVTAATPVTPKVTETSAPSPSSTSLAVAAGTPAGTVAKTVSTVLTSILTPFAPMSDVPGDTRGPISWALLALGRRGSESLDSVVTTDRATAAVTATAATGPSTATPLTQAEYDAAFTAAPPSLFANLEVLALRAVHDVLQLVGIDSRTLIREVVGLASATRPPFFFTFGQRVRQSEFEGMQVWEIAPSDPSGKYVVAIHAGGFSLQPSIPHWLYYSQMARSTGATVVVPIYPLVQDGGTAGTVVPAIADLIEQHVEDHGAENVSVFGDSAGGTIALAAAQLLAGRGATQPASMVLASPVLDLTFSNPNLALADDPLADPDEGRRVGRLWAGDLSLTDPMVSPLYGSLDGLPPTYVYEGSASVLAPDGLVLKQHAEAEGAPFTFVLARNQLEDWVLYPFGDGLKYTRQIREQLGLV